MYIHTHPYRIKKYRNKKSSTSFWDEVKFLSLRNRAPQLAKPDQVYQQDNSSTRTQTLEAFADTKSANLCIIKRGGKEEIWKALFGATAHYEIKKFWVQSVLVTTSLQQCLNCVTSRVKKSRSPQERSASASPQFDQENYYMQMRQIND